MNLEQPLKSNQDIMDEKLKDLDSKEKGKKELETKGKVNELIENVKYAISQVSGYLEHEIVSQELFPEEIKRFKKEFQIELAAFDTEEEIEVATSKKIDEINKFINDKKRRNKESKISSNENIEAMKKENLGLSAEDLENAGKDRKSLSSVLDKIDGIQGSATFYTSSFLKRQATEILDALSKIDAGDKQQAAEILKYVTNQGELKLREKIYQIALKEKLQRM